MFYPVVLKPIYKEMLWGGTKLHSMFQRQLPFDHTGESWDISVRPLEMGIVENGVFAGKPFAEVLEDDRIGFLGTAISEQKDFPLLVKLIDANDNLSVQVHPDDAYAQRVENYIFGKTEMWYVLDAPDNAKLIIGLQDGVSKYTFQKAIDDGTLDECLAWLPVQKGDVINIPAGLVHAITKGVVVAEIQQNSDITYRVYDYNRVGLDGKQRPLHVERALDVIDFEGVLGKDKIQGLSVSKANCEMVFYIANPYFAMIKYVVSQAYTETSDPQRFFIFTCVEGNCKVYAKEFVTEVNCGGSVFIPAGLGDYTIEGNCVLLKSFVPDVCKDFVEPLKEAGFTEEQLAESVYVKWQ